ncbi:hypothetical protein DEJ45_10300 [Streptomyces venezuelae]|nr:hypothetical protein DEJ45_10300 [Streptomyces venezuelae]
MTVALFRSTFNISGRCSSGWRHTDAEALWRTRVDIRHHLPAPPVPPVPLAPPAPPAPPFPPIVTVTSRRHSR